MATENHGAINNEVLLGFIEKIEKLNEDAVALAADIKEVMTQAKAAGYDPKYVRQMIKLRKMDPDELEETDALVKMYRKALGI